MRLITMISILILVIVIGALFSYLTISSLTTDIKLQLQELKINIDSDNWQQASIINDKLQDKWQKAQKILPILIDHVELHDLEITLSRVSSLLEQKEKKKILVEIDIAKRLTNNIHNQERLSFRNVF